MKTLVGFVFLIALAACGSDPSSDGPFDASPDHSADACPATIDPAMVGQPCASEGLSCGHCTDPCQFCNTIHCQGGVWTTSEAFPMPCG